MNFKQGQKNNFYLKAIQQKLICFAEGGIIFQRKGRNSNLAVFLNIDSSSDRSVVRSSFASNLSHLWQFPRRVFSLAAVNSSSLNSLSYVGGRAGQGQAGKAKIKRQTLSTWGQDHPRKSLNEAPPTLLTVPYLFYIKSARV